MENQGKLENKQKHLKIICPTTVKDSQVFSTTAVCMFINFSDDDVYANKFKCNN